MSDQTGSVLHAFLLTAASLNKSMNKRAQNALIARLCNFYCDAQATFQNFVRQRERELCVCVRVRWCVASLCARV